ncbi:MAG: hypothetical protein ACOZNI_07130 [Myxococcota bacterium]
MGDGTVDPAPLAAAGYTLERVDAAAYAARFGLEAAPILVVLDAGGALAYAGGYYDVPAAVRALDVSLLDAVRGGERPAALPVFGCAIDAGG